MRKALAKAGAFNYFLERVVWGNGAVRFAESVEKLAVAVWIEYRFFFCKTKD